MGVLTQKVLLGRKLQTTYVSTEKLRDKMNPKATSLLENVLHEVPLSFANGEMKRSETYPGLKDVAKPIGLEEFLRTWWI